MDELLVALCEDDDAERERMTMTLGECPLPCRVDCYADGESFTSAFYPGRYDLILLDIYMGGMSGVDVAARVREVDAHVPIAFVTTSQDHALDGYRLRVDRYLQKPVSAHDVAEVVEHAARRRSEAPGVTVKVDRRDARIPFSRIRFAEQQNHSVVYHLVGGDDVAARGRLDSLDDLAPKPPFFRCHQSFLVNLEHVYRVDESLRAFEMDQGDIAFIRRDSVRQAKSAFMSFMLRETRSM